MTVEKPLRFGILGAAAVASTVLVEPARELGVRVVAVAARDPERARAFAATFGVERAEPSYAALLASPDVDAVYIPLPAHLHALWALRALAAGKHVLCEKPFAANAADAERVARAARSARLVAMEGLHYRHHPLAHRVAAILAQGELGPVTHVAATLRNAVDERNTRYSLDLGGGATMDLGCYALHWARMAAGGEPTSVVAQGREGPPGIDVDVTVQLTFPAGVTASVRYAMASDSAFEGHLDVRCRDGELFVFNPLLPHYVHELRTRRGTDERIETVPGRSTYSHQLEAFVAEVSGGPPAVTTLDDAVANMRVIDAVYRSLGLPLRRGPELPPLVAPRT